MDGLTTLGMSFGFGALGKKVERLEKARTLTSTASNILVIYLAQ